MTDTKLLEGGATFRWIQLKDREAIYEFYQSILPALRDAAKKCGYALGVHGSLRRDLDLIAIPWVKKHSSKDALVVSLHRAACGIEQQKYVWEQKPLGRVAVSFPICFPEWNEPNVGHIDLSIVDCATEKARAEKGGQRGEGR